MKNFEKYEKEILEITNKGRNFTVTKNGEIKSCEEISCSNECAFYTRESPCMQKKIKWLYKEACRWTDDDIELARALKKFGVERVKRLANGEKAWFDGKDSAYLPHKAFADLQLGETIYMDDIIAEGDK